MTKESSTKVEKLPIHFRKTNRLLILGFVSAFFIYSDFSASSALMLAQPIIIGSSLAFTALAFALSFTKFGNKPKILTSIILLDSLMLGLMAGLNGFSVSSIAIIFAGFIISLLSAGRALLYCIVLFVIAFALSFYQSPSLDLARWDSANQIAIAMLLCLAIAGLYQINLELGVTSAQLTQLKKSQAGLKLRNYQIAKYLPAPLRERISRTKEVEANTSRKKLTVFFSDLVGFSRLSEEMEPNDLSRVLDSYLSAMADIAEGHGGTLDKFIGDGIMIFFGDPKTEGTKEDAEKCVAMALEMQRRMNLLQIQWRQEGIDRSLQVRMGINSGFCTVGNFGSNDRMNYTAVGTEVNLASRLETAAKPGEILLSSSTYLLIQDKYFCKNRGEVQVKGFSDPVPVFSALGDRADLDRAVDYLNYSSDGCSINIDTDAIPNYDRKKVLEALQTANDIIKRSFRS